MGIKENFGNKLLECRRQSGMTQKEVAAALGVAQPVYQRFEKGIFECSYAQIAALCKLFDVTADYLLGLTEY